MSQSLQEKYLKNPELILGGLAIIILFIHMEHFGLTIDDTFICLRFVRNWLDGHGLVFNPGEVVEGYTNFLWIVLLAGAVKVGFHGLTAAHYFGFFFGAGSLVLVAGFSRFTEGKPRAADSLAAILVAMNGSFAFYIGAGLESGMFVFLSLLGIILFLRDVDKPSIRRGLLWGFIFTLSYFSRPDGSLFFAFAFLMRLVLFRKGDFRVRLNECLAATLAFGIPLALHMLWRFGYYGEWMPNTFYAKAGLSYGRIKWGWVYVWDFFKAYSLLAPAMATLLFLFRKRATGEMALLIFSVGYVLYVILMGGDRVFPYYRFLTVFIPGLCILACRGLEVVWEIIAEKSSRPRAWAGMGAYFIAMAWISVNFSVSGPQYSVVTGNVGMHDDYVKIGNWLKNNVPPDTLVAMPRVGGIPYYSNLPTVDMLGITDPHIARTSSEGNEHIPGHNKHDFRYVLSRGPDIIIYWERLFGKYPKNIGFHLVNPGFMGFQELAQPEVRKKFEEEYGLITVPIGDKYFSFFAKKKFVEDLNL